MENRILADNGTFLNAGEFLHEGLAGDTAKELFIADDEDAYEYREIDADVLRFDALCQAINLVVLYDNVFVDDGFVDTWDSFEWLREAKTSRIGVPKPFADLKAEWLEAREAMGGDGRCAVRE